MDIVEITPAKDVNGITAITAGRLICNLIGTAVRAGYFKKWILFRLLINASKKSHY